MKNVTSFVLRRPVTTLILVLCLIFFGGMSLSAAKLELTPDIEMPMLIVTTVYGGAGPEDVCELVTKPIEEGLGTLSDVDQIASQSADNYSLVMIQYEYGTDMDNAYSDLRKRLDLVKSQLPDDVNDPTIIEMNVNLMGSMYLGVNNRAVNSIYNYVDKNVVPELEKLSSVASVDIMGGSRDYISVELIPEKLSQYRLDIHTLASLVGASSFTMPAGSTGSGSTNVNVSAGVSYKSVDEIRRIPITAGNGNILYLEDVAVVTRREKDRSAIGRYNGNDTIILGINKNNQYTAVDVSRQAMRAIDKLKKGDPNLEITVINDNSEMIVNSLKTVVQTMALAVLISMVILFIFFGDIKASLIVGTSIPLSILVALIMMWWRGYTFNVITLSSIVLGVGMMVDNSIVVLEACFRAMDEQKGKTYGDYVRAALGSVGTVGASVLGSTLTTCVVFLPLGFISGLSGQFFQPLGMTIVFCMAASLLSAVTIVPLCYVTYKPEERTKAPAYHAVRALQEGYRRFMRKILRHRRLTMLAALLLLIGSFALVGALDMTLIPEIDQGTVSVSITAKPDMKTEKLDEQCRRVEEIVSRDPDVENYYLITGGSMLGGGGDASMTVFLKEDRARSTKQVVKDLRRSFQYVDGLDISVSAYSMTAMMNSGSGYSVSLECTDYDTLLAAGRRIADGLMMDERVTNVKSEILSSAPLLKLSIDPVQAAAEGFNPKQLAGNLYVMMNGTEADTVNIGGEELSLYVEYPKDEFGTVEKVGNILLTSQSGNTVFLKDIADIRYEDSASYIVRQDKQYEIDITADYTELGGKKTAAELDAAYVAPNLVNGVERRADAMVENRNEEFGSIFRAILIAVFLVFVVMAAQFESARFSVMVMTTIPFALIGSFFLLWLCDSPLSMVSLMGFLLLVGTVVNNGILYVDTVDQLRLDRKLKAALIDAGALRLRPILMTTLTTVLSMVPMALGVGRAGALMQGLALVVVGGLGASTLMALVVLPVYYYYINGKRGVRLTPEDVFTQAVYTVEEHPDAPMPEDT